MVKKDHSVLVLKRRREEAPHRLVAPVSMGKQHCLFAVPEDFDVVLLKRVHDIFSRRNYGISMSKGNAVQSFVARARKTRQTWKR
jgi:hypothetical protein